MQDIDKLLEGIDPQLLQKAITKVLVETEGAAPPPPTRDSIPSPYAYSNLVDEETNTIIHFVGKQEVGRSKITAPDPDMKALNPELYREQIIQARIDSRAAAEFAQKYVDRGIAISKSLQPGRLKKMALGELDISADQGDILQAMAAAITCPDCGESFIDEKRLRLHSMGSAHGEYARGMPLFEKSTIWRHEQRRAKEQAEASDAGTDTETN